MNQREKNPDTLDDKPTADGKTADKPADKPAEVDENAPAPVRWPDSHRDAVTGATVDGPADDDDN